MPGSYHDLEQPTWPGHERRATKRYPIIRQVVSRRHGLQSNGSDAEGQTLNISSGGLLFTFDQPLKGGERMQIAISWPAMLDQRWPMKLVIAGRVVRYRDGLAAVEMAQYEFKTLGIKGLSF